MADEFDQYLVKQEPDEFDQYLVKPTAPSKDQQGFLGRTISNIPGSAIEYGKAMIAPVVHPVKTISDLGNVLKGLDVKIRKQIDPNISQEELRFEPYAEAAGEFFKKRYGGWENLKKTVETDPVGFTADLSTFLTGGGTALSKIGPVAKIGETAAKIGKVMDPITGMIKVGSLPAKIIPEATISKMYESAAKFSTTLSPGKRAKLVSTALEHDINISTKGMEKIKSSIDALNSEISDLVSKGTFMQAEKGERIPFEELFKGFSKLEDEARLSGRPMENLNTLKQIRKSIIDANEEIRPYGFTAEEAQKLKQKIYKDLDSYYSSVKESPMSAKAQKEIARSAKEAIEEIVPEIKYLNKREGELIELQEALQKAANRITNRDLLGIGLPIKVAAGGIPGGVRGAILGLTLGLIDTPSVKSKMALVINKLKDKGITVKPSSTAIRLGLFQVGREKEMKD